MRWPWENDPYPYVRPPGATSAGYYFEWIEQHTHIIYPLAAVGVLVLMAIGALQAMRTKGLDGVAKAEFKRDIIIELRRNLTGLPVEVLSRNVGLDNFRLLKLLEEMESDGLVVHQTTTDRITRWRVKGI